ncbi:hypothetical protein [Legionella sp. km772]|uniref:hypothetical protein n=1 Tax=Legionella sp. km772 TaxID=2498111 RepID=UPI000F8CA1E2|nr:hypothetical protein [Legionella sp. km772]RUR08770.1 hypothetical protein ELY15_10145 [Legionella sp. km772]
MSDNGMRPSSPASLFFKAHTLAEEKSSHKHDKSAKMHNEAELEKVLQKSAFKEAKKQWKTLINDLEQA